MIDASGSRRPVVVFLSCSDNIVEKIGNNNVFTSTIFGDRPAVIRLSVEELGWGVRGPLGDARYADFLRLIVEATAVKQRIDSSESDWNHAVRLLVLGAALDTGDDSGRKLFTNLFPKASYFKADQQANIEAIWGTSNPVDPAALPDGFLNFPLAELELSVRSYNCLKRNGIETIGDLIAQSQDELSEIPNLGKKSIEEVVETLRTYGLKFRDPDSTT
jgi:hypothetical protein